ncbi:bacteriohemerythrin [Denitrificimonas caeni]|uniref:bacteriohemerythrin n=1 Tax=Denitrificimonas caeni TaxID=521720 RepID=UPI0003B5B1EB|nr:bacteriohemerythrin [Denitrificimonas caeni]
MLFMPWGEHLEIGIAEIDEQHRWLVDTTNSLHALLSTGDAQAAELGVILEQLMDYTMNHFIVEEEIFDRLGYPESDAHKAQHNIFCEKVMDLLTRHDMGETVGVEALNLLKSWLTNHIVKVDKQYVEHFRAAGIAV